MTNKICRSTVTTINDVKEQPGVLFVKDVVTDLVNDETCRFYQPVDDGTGSSILPGIFKALVQFTGLEEIGLQFIHAARSAKSHGQMGLSQTGRTDEREILSGIHGRKRRKAFQLFHVLSVDTFKVKVLEGFKIHLGKPAEVEQGLYNGCLLGVTDVFHDFPQDLYGFRRQVVFVSVCGKFSHVLFNIKILCAFVDGIKSVFIHSDHHPCRN